MERQHTPGPWNRNIRPAYRYPTVFAGRNTHVAVVSTPPNMSNEEIEANCDLIVAAPEMLAALKLAERQLVLAYNDPVGNSPAVRAIEAVRAAIANAEGQK